MGDDNDEGPLYSDDVVEIWTSRRVLYEDIVIERMRSDR